MPDVPKNVAASASTVSIPLARRSKGEEERNLVRLAQNGTEAAFEELIRRHQHRVLALVGSILRRREDVEDVAQQVFLKVFISLKRFDLRSAFSTWLYKITVNECWDYLRKKKSASAYVRSGHVRRTSFAARRDRLRGICRRRVRANKRK